MNTLTDMYAQFKATTDVENERAAFLHGAVVMMDIFHQAIERPSVGIDMAVEGWLKEFEAAINDIDLSKVTP